MKSLSPDVHLHKRTAAVHKCSWCQQISYEPKKSKYQQPCVLFEANGMTGTSNDCGDYTSVLGDGILVTSALNTPPGH